jgi:hypothetical protein
MSPATRSVGQAAIWLTFVVGTVYVSGVAFDFLDGLGGAP